MLTIRPIALRGHDRDGGRRAEEAAVQIRLDHLDPLLVGHPGKQAVPRDAGVVDQHVQMRELLGHFLDHGPRLFGVADVGLRQDARASQLGDFVGNFLSLGLVAGEVDGDFGAFASQFQCDRSANPARGTRDQVLSFRQLVPSVSPRFRCHVLRVDLFRSPGPLARRMFF